MHEGMNEWQWIGGRIIRADGHPVWDVKRLLPNSSAVVRMACWDNATISEMRL